MRNDVPKNRGLAGYVTAAILSFIIGAGLSAVQLAFAHVHIGTGDEAKTGTIYCPVGEEASGNKWDGRAAPMFKGHEGIYVFSEGEVNSILREHLHVSDEAVLPGGISVGAIPNVDFIGGKRIQVSTRVNVPGFGGEQHLIYQVRGRVEEKGFVPEISWLGQCPIPLFNGELVSVLSSVFSSDKDMSGFEEVMDRVEFDLDNGYLVIDIVPAK